MINRPLITRFYAVLIMVVSAYFSYSQTKYEKESRIKPEDVPSGAVEFVSDMSLPGKIKWYKETGLEQFSFEGKTKVEGRRYSIEFSQNGEFEDLEIEIKNTEIPKETLASIEYYLTAELTKFKIRKVQIQYTGNKELIKNNALNLKDVEGLNIQYELIVYAKVDGEFTAFEYLFDSSGAYLKRSGIILKMTDNIEY